VKTPKEIIEDNLGPAPEDWNDNPDYTVDLATAEKWMLTFGGELQKEVDSLKRELADAYDACESYKEQLQNSYLREGQNINREFMG
jgi:hypothetical protein